MDSCAFYGQAIPNLRVIACVPIESALVFICQLGKVGH